MGQAVFKRIQFLCNYFEAEASHVGGQVPGMQPATAPRNRMAPRRG